MAQTDGPQAAAVDAPRTPAQPAAPDTAATAATAATSATTSAGAQAGAGRDGEGADRVAELEAALAAAESKAAEHWDKYLRERAEMENYKRRLERTYADQARRARKDLLLKFLGVADNLERAVSYQASSGGGDPQQLLTGLRLTYDQFKDVLSAEGL